MYFDVAFAQSQSYFFPSFSSSSFYCVKKNAVTLKHMPATTMTIKNQTKKKRKPLYEQNLRARQRLEFGKGRKENEEEWGRERESEKIHPTKFHEESSSASFFDFRNCSYICAFENECILQVLRCKLLHNT